MIRILYFITLLLFTNHVFSQQNNTNFVDGEIYIKIKPQFVKPTSLLSRNTNLNLEIPAILNLLDSETKKSAKAIKPFINSKNKELQGVYRLKIDSKFLSDELIKKIKSELSVDYVEKVRIRHFDAIPDDTRYFEQWGLNKIKANEAWSEVAGISDVIVAVVDNAIQTNHPDLQANVILGRDVADEDDNPNPPDSTFSHGTHVAGIISAVTNNHLGIASAANNKIKIMVIKATPNGGSPNSIYYGFEGVQWAVANGAKIINLSWGGTDFSQLEQDIINDAKSNGVIIIASAGNSNSEALNFPAAYNNVISVASLELNDTRSSFSSFGSTVDISAPGRSILSTIPFDKYGNFSGTSMAAPLVASCFGYIKSCFPTMSNDSIEILIKNTADDISTQNPNFIGKLGAGRINLLKAISCRSKNLTSPILNNSGSTYICNGDSVVLSTILVSSATYKLFKNNVEISNGYSSYSVKDVGKYQVSIQSGNCSVKTDIKNVKINSFISTTPFDTSIERFYCDSSNSILLGNAALNTKESIYTFNYGGPVIGYDGGKKSAVNPSILVNNVPGLIDSIFVSITWQKKDGGDEFSCGILDRGGTPFNEELSFELISPDGIKLNLINSDTYARGIIGSGLVTTIFKAGKPKVAPNSIPISGVFDGFNSLGSLKNEVPNGTWTLIPGDNSALDPLCVSGFSISIVNTIRDLEPNLSWWDSKIDGNILVQNDSLSLINAQLGKNYFYLQNQYQGYCPSIRSKGTVKVKPVPEILAFNKGSILISSILGNEILDGSELMVNRAQNNLYYINGKFINGLNFSELISNSSPESSPVTFCDSTDYFLLAMGCNGKITWNTGDTTQAIYVSKLKTSQIFTASCSQNWNCTPLTETQFEFKLSNEIINLTEDINANSLLKVNGAKLNSSQKIDTTSKVKYFSIQNIELMPGFEVNGPTVFSAEINTCQK